jgi:glycosyltransferase involved in cell wall biosynthesis/molybdenum cofactor biosynthesis enzyme MoaA
MMTQDPNDGFIVHQPGKLSRGGVLDVGLKCVHSCRFCYYSYLDKSDDQFKGMRRAEFRTLDECKAILRGLKQNGFINFDYTGGEPTLHPDIIEITRYAHQELGLKGRIITLGQYLMRHMKHGRQEKLIDDLLDAGLTNFLFSMHAVDEELFKRLTGESWEKQRRAMEHLDEKGFQFTTNTTIVEWNYKHLPAIAREVLRHGSYLHNFIIMNAYYEWNKDGKAFGVQAKYSDIHPYLQEAVDILESNNVGVNIRYAPLCALHGMEKNVVGVVGVRYDPYEWMNVGGHMGGSPEACATRVPIREGGIEPHLEYHDLNGQFENGVRVSGARGSNFKLFADKCATCQAKPACDGIDPNYLKNHGPDEFAPYHELQVAPLHKARYPYIVPFIVKTEQYADMKTVVAEAFAAYRKATKAAKSPTTIPGRPKVSVVVTCYNYGRYLAEAVDSIVAQTFQDFEIVIVNDGSTDDSLQVAEQLVRDHPTHRIRIVDQKNSGQPALSRNAGVAQALGEYILCLDADDCLGATMLEECVRVLDSDPNVAIAYTDRLDFDGVDQVVHAADYNAQLLPYQNHISYCALYRRRVWDDVGGYRDNVKGTEDWDFWVAAAVRGHYGRRIAQPLFHYRRHDTGLYQHALQNFDKKRARIMLNNPQAYNASDLAWARQTLGEPAAVVPSGSVRNAALHSANPLVTVIVPTHNRPGLLKDALASLVAQDYGNWEAIVVNDGGPSVAELVATADPVGRIRYVEHRRSFGPAAARNGALRVARGDIVCYLDDDDFFRPNHLSTVVETLAMEGRSFVYTDAEIVVEDMQDGKRITGERGNPYRHEQYSRERLLVANFIPINTWAHRWECVAAVGFFDETLESFEDWEFLLRIARRYELVHVPVQTVEVRWRRGRSDCRTAHQAAHHVEVYRRIYAGTDDLANDAIRQAREQALAGLAQQLGASAAVPAPAAKPVPVTTPTVEAAAAESAGDNEKFYEKWMEKHQPEEIDGQIYAEHMVLNWRTRPVVHLVIPLRREDEARLADTIDSLGAQLHRDWRLTVVADYSAPDVAWGTMDALKWVQAPAEAQAAALMEAIKDVPADWVGVLAPGVRLAPNALFVCADYANLRPAWRLIYSDEDRLDSAGKRHDPRFKPDFNLDLLRSSPYFGSFVLVQRDALLQLGGYVPDGAGNYDLSLRVLDAFGEDSIGHIADVLWHAPGGTEEAPAACRAALQRHLERRGVRAVVADAFLPQAWRVAYEHVRQPRVSILVPTHDKLEYLQPCVESLLSKTAYGDFELIVVDNASTDPDAIKYLAQLPGRLPGRVRVLAYPHEFNYAAIGNFAATHATGEYLLFLDNDTQIVQAEWLARMMAHAQRPEVGIVGARLVYPETGVLQHAGAILGMDLAVGAPYQNLLTLKDPGYLGRALVEQDLSAVSGSCLLVRKDVFDEAGGFDADAFAAHYPDTDLCLRVREHGHKIVWTPYATLVHHGAASRNELARDIAGQARMAQETLRERDALLDRWMPQLADDPAYNRHLSLLYRDCRVDSDVVINWDPNFRDRPRVLGMPLSGGSGEYRVIQPLRALSHAGYVQYDLAQAPFLNQARLLNPIEVARAKPDTLVFHAAISDGELDALRQIRRHTKTRRVFMLDDLVTGVPEKSTARKRTYRDAKRRLRDALALSDSLVVTTQPLADLGAGMIDDIRVLPNYLDARLWGNLQSLRRQGRKPRVGWAGAQQHHGDLDMIIEVVKATAAEVEWVFLGMCLDELRPYVAEVHGFELKFEDYARRLASLNLDLAVAPLELHPFNEAKSNLRLLEYGALGWPVVCTDILPYQNGPVTRVPNVASKWIEAIRERAHDLDAAEREGQALRAWVYGQWMLQDHLPEWFSVMTDGIQAAPEMVAAVQALRAAG